MAWGQSAAYALLTFISKCFETDFALRFGMFIMDRNRFYEENYPLSKIMLFQYHHLPQLNNKIIEMNSVEQKSIISTLVVRLS